ncbi:hypothetical protein M3Y97_00318800 [Aphelenchoides bicaudatus]|nr:hypothetical protein M3Y97_00318800 [Aphelenchoides bicaudatus]
MTIALKPLLLFAVFLSVVFAGEFGKNGLRRMRRDELPRAMPPPTHNTTMFKLHDYFLTANTTIEHWAGSNELEKLEQTLKAKFSWDNIHADMESHAIYRFKLLSCLEGDCGPIEVNKTHFVELRQGRQALRTLWKNSTDPMPQWSIFQSVLMALTMPSSEDDRSEKWHYAQNPLGQCQYRFQRKNDTQHLREIRNCDFSAFHNESLLNGLVVLDYESDVESNLNAKYHGRLHLIRGTERFRVYSPLHPRFGYTITSKFRMDLEKFEDPYWIRYCNGTWSAERCATEAMELESVGKTWKDITDKVEFEKREESEQILANVDPKNKADVFHGLLHLSNGLSPHDFIALFDALEDENQRIQHLQAFAQVGEVDLTYMQKHLEEAFDVYLQALAHRAGEGRVVIQELKKLLKNDHSPLPISVFTALVNRDCQKSPSKLNNCNNADNANILKILSQLETCNMNTDECDGHSTYAALEQIPIERICKHAAQLVCMSPTDVHDYVLNVLQHCDPVFFKAKDIRLLMNVFHNSCYEPVQDSWSLQALEILLRSYAKQPLGGTLLLRSEVEALEKQTKWSYFHQAERAMLNKWRKSVEGWKQLRNFKVFERNYNNHAISGNATVDLYLLPIENLGRLAITVQQVGSNQTRRNSLEVLLQGESSEIELLSLHQGAVENRLLLIGTLYPKFEWESQQINIPIADAHGRVPLLSNLQLDVRTNAILHLDFQPLKNPHDFRLKAQLRLTSLTESKETTLKSSVDIQTSLSVEQGKVNVGAIDLHQTSDTNKKGRRRHVVYPGRCLRKVN